jgi:hypothetical protein
MIGAATLVPPMTYERPFIVNNTPVFGSANDAISGVIRLVPGSEF